MPAGLLPIIYLAFISLGLPDSALGSAWPSMAPQLGAGISWVGAVTMIISAGTIVSSLMSVRVVDRFGTGRVTVASVLLTAAGLLGFALSGAFWQLVPLGGAVRPGRRRGRRGAQRVRRYALQVAAHELAALHVGRRARAAAR